VFALWSWMLVVSKVFVRTALTGLLLCLGVFMCGPTGRTTSATLRRLGHVEPPGHAADAPAAAAKNGTATSSQPRGPYPRDSALRDGGSLASGHGQAAAGNGRHRHAVRTLVQERMAPTDDRSLPSCSHLVGHGCNSASFGSAVCGGASTPLVATDGKELLSVTPRMLGRLAAHARRARGTRLKNGHGGRSTRGSRGDVVDGRIVESLQFGDLVVQATRAKKEVLYIKADMEDARRVIVHRSLRVEARRGSPLPPLLKCLVVVAMGQRTTLTLRFLTIEALPGREVVLELQDSARCELVDCRLRGGGIHVGHGCSARLLRTSVSDVRGCGIVAERFEEVTLQECQVARCSGDGLRLGVGQRVNVVDCTISDNGLNGAVVDSTSIDCKLDGCTLSGNGQYGIWANAGALVAWGHNSIVSNGIGEKGGKGVLRGWLPGISFRHGDACAVWSEQHGSWLSGSVLRVTPDMVTVAVQATGGAAIPVTSHGDPGTGMRSLAPAHELPSETAMALGSTAGWEATGRREVIAGPGMWPEMELVVRPDAVRQLRSGPTSAPTWSRNGISWRASGRGGGAYQLFLHEGGTGRAAWRALPPEKRQQLQARARKADSKKRRAAAAASSGAGGSDLRVAGNRDPSQGCTTAGRRRPILAVPLSRRRCRPRALS